MTEKQFKEEIKKLNLDITEEKLLMLKKYYQLLVIWNKKMNLTSILKEEEVYLKHFYDSLTLSKIFNFHNNLSIADVGTGAGFPGIVLKIFFPQLKLTLIDSNNKKTLFLNEVIRELNLENVEVIHTRVEEYAKTNKGIFDVITIRAVGNISMISELCIPLLKLNGYFIVMKANIVEERKEIKKILNILNSKIEKMEKFNLPYENSKRSIILIKKIKPTDKKYPRNFQKIQKNPL